MVSVQYITISMGKFRSFEYFTSKTTEQEGQVVQPPTKSDGNTMDTEQAPLVRNCFYVIYISKYLNSEVQHTIIVKITFVICARDHTMFWVGMGFPTNKS